MQYQTKYHSQIDLKNDRLEVYTRDEENDDFSTRSFLKEGVLVLREASIDENGSIFGYIVDSLEADDPEIIGFEEIPVVDYNEMLVINFVNNELTLKSYQDIWS